MIPEESLPERRLMQAVILNAIGDATGRKGDTRRPYHVEKDKREAIRWIAEAGPDFQRVCELAGMSPDMVRARALAFIASADPMPRVVRNPSAFDRDPLSPASIAGHAGVSVSAVRGVLKYGLGSVEMKDRVRRSIEQLSNPERLAA
jgi:hypothetical protein